MSDNLRACVVVAVVSVGKARHVFVTSDPLPLPSNGAKSVCSVTVEV